MAGFASVSEDIRTAFNAAWSAGSFSAVPVYWTNDPRPTTQPDAEDEFLRLSILESQSAFRPEIGARMAEVHGVVIAQVFTEAGRGDKRSRQLCDAVRDAIQGQRHGAARFQGTRRDERGLDDNGRHFHANVTTPFRFDSTPS